MFDWVFILKSALQRIKYLEQIFYEGASTLFLSLCTLELSAFAGHHWSMYSFRLGIFTALPTDAVFVSLVSGAAHSLDRLQLCTQTAVGAAAGMYILLLLLSDSLGRQGRKK